MESFIRTVLKTAEGRKALLKFAETATRRAASLQTPALETTKDRLASLGTLTTDAEIAALLNGNSPVERSYTTVTLDLMRSFLKVTDLTTLGTNAGHRSSGLDAAKKITLLLAGMLAAHNEVVSPSGDQAATAEAAKALAKARQERTSQMARARQERTSQMATAAS